MLPPSEQRFWVSAEASPLWPLVLLLAEIAARVERDQVAELRETPLMGERPEDAPLEGAVS